MRTSDLESWLMDVLKCQQPIVFDVTRVCHRRLSGVPTGIDRIDFSFLRRMMDLPHLDIKFVYGAQQEVFFIHKWFIRCLVKYQSRVWSGSKCLFCWDFLYRLALLLCFPGSVYRPKTAISSNSILKFRSLAGLLCIFCRACQPSKSFIYINCGHRGLLEYDKGIFFLKNQAIQTYLYVHDYYALTPGDPEYTASSTFQSFWHNALQLHPLHLMVNSRHTATVAKTLLGERNLPISVVLPSMDHLQIQLEDPMDNARPFFICPGTVSARKNTLFLLDVWELWIQKEVKNIPQLLIATHTGASYLALLERISANQKLSDLVRIETSLNDIKFFSLQKYSLGVLLPSQHESFGFCYWEAISLQQSIFASSNPIVNCIHYPQLNIISALNAELWQQTLNQHMHSSQSNV